MANVHQVWLGRQVGPTKLTPCTYDGDEILRSDKPIHDCARYLLKIGAAEPDDAIETWSELDGKLCMYGIVGPISEQTVREHPRLGLSLSRYVPFDPGRFKGQPVDDLEREAAE